MGVSTNGRFPTAGWCISWEILSKWMIYGAPPISGNLHIVIFFGGFFKWGITQCQNHRFIVIDMLVFDIILVS